MYALTTAKKTLEAAVGMPVGSPKDATQADVCVPCFAPAKKEGKNPAELAQSLVRKTFPPAFERATAAGPYANYFFSETFYRQVISETAQPDYGCQPMPKSKAPYVLEYSQPNPGKPMHLGHIRSTIIGDVCANALQHMGRPVVRLNYLNDRGAHIAELITAMETFKDLPKVTDEKSLLAYYVKIKADIENDPALKEKTRQVLEHLKDHEKQLVKIRDMSWAAFQRNYDALGVTFDDIPFETTLESDSRARVQECLDKKLAKKEPDGTIITQLEPETSNTVLLRSNGTPLYFTSDLALADWKWAKYHFDTSMIFTASEQNLHFRQLQTLLTKLGRTYAPNYLHKGFGLIRLTEGKLSTRQGRVVLLEDVIRSVTEEANDQMKARNPDAKPEEAIARAVGIGALKYGVLKVKLEKDITFDPKTEVQFEGDTSAYVQYAHVRACAILDKFAGQAEGPHAVQNANGKGEKGKAAANSGKEKNNKKKEKIAAQSNATPARLSASAMESIQLPPLPAKLDLNESERLLLKKLAEFPDALDYVATTMQPHALCEYALQVAKAFTSFYAASPVLTAEKAGLKAQRLHITASTKNVLALALGVLGINALEKM
ncbi:arginine--tRNA ligase [Candidatus Micrarchaeota archaeon]|nr:arginine--tRNA ligase [Candidatus Micrarchaeota archaeon]